MQNGCVFGLHDYKTSNRIRNVTLTLIQQSVELQRRHTRVHRQQDCQSKTDHPQNDTQTRSCDLDLDPVTLLIYEHDLKILKLRLRDKK